MLHVTCCPFIASQSAMNFACTTPDFQCYPSLHCIGCNNQIAQIIFSMFRPKQPSSGKSWLLLPGVEKMCNIKSRLCWRLTIFEGVMLTRRNWKHNKAATTIMYNVSIEHFLYKFVGLISHNLAEMLVFLSKNINSAQCTVVWWSRDSWNSRVLCSLDLVYLLVCQVVSSSNCRSTHYPNLCISTSSTYTWCTVHTRT